MDELFKFPAIRFDEVNVGMPVGVVIFSALTVFFKFGVPNFCGVLSKLFGLA